MTTEEQQLVAQRLRERAVFTREAGHNDDADLDVEAADTITRLVEERDRWEAACDGNTALGAEIAEKLKAGLDRAEAKVAELQEALMRMTRRFELYAGPNDMHAGHHDLELLTAARRALEQSK